MAKSKVTAQDMASRLMGSGASKPLAQSSTVQDVSELPAPLSPSAKNKTSIQSSRKAGGTKRLNLNITIQQWRKLKNHAMNQDMSVSDVIRDCIDAL